MEARNCPHCGAAVPPGAGTCPYCGQVMPARSSAGVSIPSSSTYTRPIPASSGRSRPRHLPSRPVWVGLLVIVLVIAATAVVVWYVTRPATVNVSAIEFDAPSGTCGLAGFTTDGFSAAVGSTYPLVLSVTNRLASSCSIASVTTSTGGFAVSSANVPLSLAAGGSGLLTFNLGLPSEAYQGPLVLVVG